MIRTLSLLPCEKDYSAEIAQHSGDEVLTYKTVGSRKLSIALYHPKVAREKHPLIVFVHGGGWRGRKVFDDQAEWSGDYLGFLARYYAERGFVCASIDYRLLDDGCELVDLCRDCADAVAYLKAHAEEWRIDPERTAVLGESAGGYLAAALTTLPWMDLAFFKRAIIVNGITDLTDPRWGVKMSAQEQVALSPVCHINECTCPTLLIHGAEDNIVWPFHSLKYYELLMACGQQAQLDWIEKTNHAFLLAEYMQEKGVALDAMEAAIASIDEWLHQ